MTARAVLAGLMLLMAAPAVTRAADRGAPAPARPPAGAPENGITPPPPSIGHPGMHADVPHPPPVTGELDCRACHQREHTGVIRMFLGSGGRGTPRMPSHMAELRVECVACHVEPKEKPGAAMIVGQTYRVSERACIDCHGEKYRGMLERWTTTLASMRGVVTKKLDDIRGPALDAKGAKAERARKLVDDADYNVRFVQLGHGAHNVFYAADLLKVANGWADEAAALIGKPASKVDDTLVRGRYCAVLCHEQAGVKQPPGVTYGKLKVPHVRHVTELGATCTACHSAETHKAVTAKPRDCASCHHSPRNEKCEACHSAQAAFYRGTLGTKLAKVEPNSMANAVPCTGCHDWSAKHSRAAIGQKCLGCHDKSYDTFMGEWTKGLDAEVKKTADVIQAAETAVAKARRSGKAAEAATLLRDARNALAMVKRARGVHNPAVADALLTGAREKAAAARSSVNGR